jgi:hypothetical protein
MKRRKKMVETELKRIPYGGEQGTFKGWAETGENCPDCGVEAGQYHKENCDIEECPTCHIGQYWYACACNSPRQAPVQLDPLAELGEALAAKWNKIERSPKYGYDSKTHTITSRTGTGFDFVRHLHEVLGESAVA